MTMKVLSVLQMNCCSMVDRVRPSILIWTQAFFSRMARSQDRGLDDTIGIAKLHMWTLGIAGLSIRPLPDLHANLENIIWIGMAIIH
ncbi:hypothetical protein REPUB_Repub04eG0203200 [Reevesia pubescens]